MISAFGLIHKAALGSPLKAAARSKELAGSFQQKAMKTPLYGKKANPRLVDFYADRAARAHSTANHATLRASKGKLRALP